MPSTTEILGVNIPLLIFNFGIAVGAISARIHFQTNHTISSYNSSNRIYTSIFLISSFFIVTLCLTLASHFQGPNVGFITAIVAVYFENALPWVFWWLMVEIMGLASYPHAQQCLQRQQQISCMTHLLVYNRRCVYLFGTVMLTVLCIILTFFVAGAIGLVVLNFVVAIHLLCFLGCIIMCGASPTKDVLYSLGGPFWLFATLMMCIAIGSILLGVFILIPYFFAAGLIQKIITIVLIKYAGVFALVTALVAFPRTWIQHIRSAEIQCDMMESSNNNNNAADFH
ncbi:hypothetical protein BDA99DRAFT_517826 [Phascolomyces articulosus]|uniref:Uncharacterized protein n=1 Tax=Phascolomyces articulosus TaxID=60185 RepID=A0AAD5K7U9_9FUNG|nr:hypothetical protein BDA99DRAFT_517826 [Phascolomyces articulosus]